MDQDEQEEHYFDDQFQTDEEDASDDGDDLIGMFDDKPEEYESDTDDSSLSF